MARRVNTRFLTGISVTVLVVLIGIFGASRLLGRGAYVKALPLARKAAAEGNINAAVDLYKEALAGYSKRPDLRVELGDFYYKNTRFNMEFLGQFVRLWESALEMDATYKPAAERLFNASLDATEVQASAEGYEMLRRRAEKLYQIDKRETKAEAYRHLAVIGHWLAGGSTPEQRVEQAVDQALAIWRTAPDLAQIPLLVSRAYLRMAYDRRSANPALGGELFDRAMALMEEAVAMQPGSAEMRWRQFQVLAAVVESADEPETASRMARRLRSIIQQALALLQPDDTRYVEIQLAAAQHLQNEGRREESMASLKALAEQRPKDDFVRIALGAALRLDPKQRAQAIELLNQQISPDVAYSGYRVMRRVELEYRRLMELTEARLEACQQATEPAARQQLLEQIEQSYQAAAKLVQPNNPDLLDIQARKLLLKNPGALVEAIQLLQSAHDRTTQTLGFNVQRAVFLAERYIQANEYGQGRVLLQQVLDRRPGRIDIRRMLARLLAMEGRQDEFRTQVELLEKQAPDDPEVKQLRLLTIDTRTNRAQLEGLLASLPEDTDAARFNKARTAFALGDRTLATRLLEAVRNVDEFRVRAVRMLAQLYVDANQRDRAEQVVKEALEKDQHASLRVLQASLIERRSPEEMQALLKDIIEDIADPVERALRTYRLARQQRKDIKEARASLDEALKANPEEIRIHEALFQLALEQQAWEQAAKHMEKLIAANTDRAGGMYVRFELAMAQAKYPEARDIALKLTQKLPEFSRSWLALAKVDYAMQQYAMARDNYAKVLQRQPGNAEALRGMIECSSELQQDDAVRQYLRQAMSVLPNDPVIRNMSLRHEELSGRAEKVVPQRRQILQERPDLLDNWLSLALSCLRAGDTRRRLGLGGFETFYEQARQVLQDAKARWPDEPSLYARQADALLALGKAEEGITAIRELGTRPAWKDKPEPSLMLGQFCWRLGKLPQAEEAIKEAVARTPAQGRLKTQLYLVQFYIGSSMAQRDNLDKAIALLRELAESTKDLQVSKMLIETQIKAGQLEAAEKTLATVAAQQNSDPELLSLQGVLLLQKRQVPQAQQKFDQAIKIDARCRAALQYRGRIYLTQNRLEPAQKDLTLARELNPSDVDVRTALSEVYRRQGDASAAIQEMEGALQLAPFSRETRLRLVELCVQTSRIDRALELVQAAQNMTALAKDPVWYIYHSQLVSKSDPGLAIQKIQQARQLAPQDGALAYRQVELFIAAKAPRQALQLLEQMAASPGADKEWRLPLLRAMAKAADGNRDGALLDFEASMALAVEDDVARGVLGRMVQTLGPKEAIRLASDRARVEGRWRGLLGLLYLENQEFDQAIASIQAARLPADFNKLSDVQKLVILQAAARVYLAAASRNAAHYVAAADAYLEYLKLADAAKLAISDVGRVSIHNNLAWLFSESIQPPNLAAAEEHARKAYEIMQKLGAPQPLVLDTYGWVLVLTGKIDAGIGLLRAAVDRDPTMVEAAYHIGEAHLRKNDAASGQAFLEQARILIEERQRSGLNTDDALKQKVEASLDRVRKLAKSKAGGAAP